MKESVRRKAFTLVELLVVVAIIVILIAMLVPALNKVLYIATLTECSANMDGFGSAVTVYAHANKDRYPQRNALEATFGRDEGSPAWLIYSGQMGVLKFASDQNTSDVLDPTGGSNVNPTADKFDDREMWNQFLDVRKIFIDPFTDRVDLMSQSVNPDESNYEENDYVMASQDILVGWRWLGEGKMAKLGSRVTWTAPGGHPDAGKIFSWNLLMMDKDVLIPDFSDGFAVFTNQDGDEFQPSLTSHPDKGGVLELDTNAGTDDSEHNRSIWWSLFSKEGPRNTGMDRNFLRTDGSVETITDVVADKAMISPEMTITFSPSWTSQFPGPYDYRSNDKFTRENFVVVPFDSFGDYTWGSSLMPRQ